jgi:hypothetical protein
MNTRRGFGHVGELLLPAVHRLTSERMRQVSVFLEPGATWVAPRASGGRPGWPPPAGAVSDAQREGMSRIVRSCPVFSASK